MSGWRGALQILDLIRRTASARVALRLLRMMAWDSSVPSSPALRAPLCGFGACPPGRPKPEGLSCAMQEPATLRPRFDPTLSDGSHPNFHSYDFLLGHTRISTKIKLLKQIDVENRPHDTIGWVQVSFTTVGHAACRY